MADEEAIKPEPSPLPTLTPEQRKVAVGLFDRANQVITTGNFDYGIKLLRQCCKLDPASLIYRQTLRRAEKAKYKNNKRGSRMAAFTTAGTRAKLKAAKHSGDHLKVLEIAEEILVLNPWDTGAQLDMAEAADKLGLLDLGVWTLDQAREKDPADPVVNRALARLYEKRGNFVQAIALWELVRKKNPRDPEAQHKAKDLAASDTIARTQKARAESEVRASAAPPASTAAPPPAPKAGKPAEPAAAKPPEQEAMPATVGSLRAPPADRFAQETTTLRKRIESDPTNANAYLHLAGVYRRAGQIEQARELLEEALGPTGNDFDIQMELAELELEPFRQNLLATEQKLRASPQDEELRKLRARFRKEINTRELEMFRRRVDRYPTDKAARFELGVRLLRADQTDAAIRELQVVRSDPRFQWRSLLYLGHCFKQRNNWRLAQRNFEEALTHLPAGEDKTRKELLFQLAKGAAENNELSKAVDLGTELANLDFSFHDIGRLLDEWQERLNSESSAKRT